MPALVVGRLDLEKKYLSLTEVVRGKPHVKRELRCSPTLILVGVSLLTIIIHL